MRAQELLIGFDAREMEFNIDARWSEKDKKTYLLRQDIYKPLSLDRDVWKTVFNSDYPIELPLWRGPVQNLWNSLAELEKYTIHMPNLELNACWVIGVTQLVDAQSSIDLQKLYDLEPDTVSRKWSLLGYDVCNQAFLSGLSNCGYRDDEVDEAIRRWKSSLNEYHLLKTREDALEFQEWTEQRVIAHGPFAVYGLYLIQTVPSHQVNKG